MSWTTATRVFLTALVFVLSCSTCVASPVNETVSYECLTNDDCRTANITDYSRIQGKLYCCRSGDVIELSFKGDGYGFVSSFFGFSDYTGSSNNYIVDNSDASSNESSEDSDEKRSESRGSDVSSDQSDNSTSERRDANGDVTCTCKQVDVEKIRNRFNDYFHRMYQNLERWFSRLSWW